MKSGTVSGVKFFVGRCFWLYSAAFLMVMSFSFGVVSYVNLPVSSAPQPGLVDSADLEVAIPQNKIGERVESVLRNAVYLEVTTTVTQTALDGDETLLLAGPGPYTIRSIMAKEAFKTLVRDGENRLIMAFALCAGVIKEYRPAMMENKPPHEFKSPFPHGMDNPAFPTEQDCVAGGNIFSWVGVPPENSFPMATDMARSMRFKVDGGVQEADVVERGRKCSVFRKRTPDGAVEDVVYVDRQTFLVIRWDTTRFGMKRIRLSDIRLMEKIPPDVNWEITAADRSEPEAVASNKE